MWRVAALFLVLSVSLCEGTGPSRKIFQDINCIDTIDPLLKGFSVTLPQDLISKQLSHIKSPTLYLSAIPLNPRLDQVRRIKLDVDPNPILFGSLVPEQWYYICVEFENTNRADLRGNFSGTCVLERTLDKYGSKKDQMVADVDRIKIDSEDAMMFRARVEVNFPIFLEAYLTNEGKTITYFLDQPREISIIFNNLTPGKDYGRICFRQTPVDYHYTGMGLSVQKSLESCFFGGLHLKGDPKAARYSYPDPEVYPRRSSGSSAVETLSATLLLMMWSSCEILVSLLVLP